MDTLQIYMFGRLSIRNNGVPLTTFGIQKVQELLAYLLIHRHAPHHREYLANLLWEDASSAQSKQYFRKTLWQLQAALDKCNASSQVLIVEDEWIQVNERANIWLDLTELENVYQQVHSMPGGEVSPEQQALLAEVVNLYHGESLHGWYQDWCLNERERCQHMYLVILDRLVEYCLAHGHFIQGIDYCGHILRCDTARERTHRQLMLLYALSGDRTGALHQYERCAAILDKELSVAPAASTIELYQLICNNIQLDSALYAGSPMLTQAAGDPILLQRLHTVAHFLGSIQKTLDDLQMQVNEQRRAIEESLPSQTDS